VLLKTRMMWLPASEKKYMNVTDSKTDRNTVHDGIGCTYA